MLSILPPSFGLNNFLKILFSGSEQVFFPESFLAWNLSEYELNSRRCKGGKRNNVKEQKLLNVIIIHNTQIHSADNKENFFILKQAVCTTISVLHG